jgi:hypothetical protein
VLKTDSLTCSHGRPPNGPLAGQRPLMDLERYTGPMGRLKRDCQLGTRVMVKPTSSTVGHERDDRDRPTRTTGTPGKKEKKS